MFNLEDTKRPKSLLAKYTAVTKPEEKLTPLYPEPLTPRQLAARKGVETKNAKKEVKKMSARKAAVTRKQNDLKKKVALGIHSANKTFDALIKDDSMRTGRLTK